jgi:hypothetical protein
VTKIVVSVVILKTASFALLYNVFSWLSVNGYRINKRVAEKYFSFNRKGIIIIKCTSRGQKMPLGLTALFAPGLIAHWHHWGETRNAYRILLGKPEGRRSLGRPRRRWVDNIKMNLREIGWNGLDGSGSG